ncbi:MAG: PEP-CTERM sorting domain-containing protein [Capsulimonadales bacterium]|nr:PEP-CTERM sorting domain-containing protein [Capsulimonadales bacterium]
MTKRALSVLVSCLLALFATLAAPARAQLTFTLQNSSVTVVQNETASITATLLNETGTAIDLNELVLSVDPPLTFDPNPFLNNFPFTINPGESFTGVLFDIRVPFDAPVGTYGGLVSLNDLNGPVTEILPFTVNVTATTAPEPGVLALLLLAGVPVGMVRLRVRR